MKVTRSTTNLTMESQTKRRRIDERREWLEVSEAFNGLKGQAQQVRLFLERVVTPERGVSVEDTVELLLPSTLDDVRLLKAAAAQFVDAVDGVDARSPDDEARLTALLQAILTKSRSTLVEVARAWTANVDGGRVANAVSMLQETMQESMATIDALMSLAIDSCRVCGIDVDVTQSTDDARRLATLDDDDDDDDGAAEDVSGVNDECALVADKDCAELAAMRLDREFIVLEDDEDNDSFDDGSSSSDYDDGYSSSSSSSSSSSEDDDDDESESDDDDDVIAPIHVGQ